MPLDKQDSGQLLPAEVHTQTHALHRRRQISAALPSSVRSMQRNPRLCSTQESQLRSYIMTLFGTGTPIHELPDGPYSAIKADFHSGTRLWKSNNLPVPGVRTDPTGVAPNNFAS